MTLKQLLLKALSAKLSKTEHQAMLVFILKFYAYKHKTSDPISFGQLAELMDMRKDHVKKAAQSIVDKGFFTREPIKKYDFLYTIAHAERLEVTHESKPDQEKSAEPQKPDLLTYPEEISDETKTAIRQTLSTLPQAQAQSVIDRLAQAIRHRENKKHPIAMGMWLIGQVKRGNLSVLTPQSTDTTIRFSPQQPTQTPTQTKHPDLEARFRDSFFAQVAALTGSTIEAVKAQHGCHV